MEERVFGGRYRATEQIGSGGMADVYKAVDQVLGRTVAIKVLHPRYAADPTFVARFRQEAQAAANLSNPHIVNIYDWGQEDSTYYIVMEYVRGTDLKALIDEKGPIDPAKAAEYAAQVCSALSVAHGYDIVHRDIKPHNIVLMADGTVKVMDFGIARAGNTTMTQTGSVLGTAQYISPEQAQGRPIGPSSDLYSLGIVLYEMTTGRLPFEGDTPVAVALKQVNEQAIPPRQINPAIPPALESVILRAMEKDPSKRYASADEMRDDLRRVIAGQPVAGVGHAADETSVMPVVTATPAPVRREEAAPRRRSAAWAWVLALIALVLIGGLIAWAAGILTPPKNVQVPDVTNHPVSEATATIIAAGLKVGPLQYSANPDVRRGYVISQSPPAKTPLPPGQEVDLVISQGPEMVKIPDLSGMTEQDAVNAIQGAGFKVGNITTQFNKAPAGTVFAQDPKPDTLLPVGTAVNFSVSQGVEKHPVPDVTGKAESDARDQLTGAGFKVKTTQQFSSTVSSGIVIDTDPTAGTSLAVGSTVTLIVSKGPNNATIPGSIIGDTTAHATSVLQGLGFRVDVSTDTTTPAGQTPDTVHDSKPSAGSSQPVGSTVTIIVYPPAAKP